MKEKKQKTKLHNDIFHKSGYSYMYIFLLFLCISAGVMVKKRIVPNQGRNNVLKKYVFHFPVNLHR